MQITYQNKEYLNQNPSIPAINKVTDDDMNEIKTVVNTNDIDTQNAINHINEYITASPSSDVTLTTTNATKLSLDTSTSVGSSLSLDNGSILIGAGVSKILINANILFSTGGTGSSTSDRKGINIQKNTTTVHYCSIPSTATYIGCSLSSFLLDVQENDVITLNGVNQGAKGSVVSAAQTYITVKVVE